MEMVDSGYVVVEVSRPRAAVPHLKLVAQAARHPASQPASSLLHHPPPPPHPSSLVTPPLPCWFPCPSSLGFRPSLHF
ncbi:hypothetical protein Pcinc_011611 [Petrolisthes cinctipes]|uniref:Uncharacterized protein n=1 Tax=Petrolisthes cinctipes TaxID=88211 RepID=A0AAE1G2S1_PETCI|nr:hypothetical protein Pcinc_011611 [Petrolisthes cinctipes]